MLKKTMLLAVSAAALAAFAVPTVASAQLLKHTGVALAVGAEVTATSTNLETTTGLGNLTCKKVTIHGTVTENTKTSSKVASTSVTTESCDILTLPSKVVDSAIITNASAGFVIAKKEVGTASAAFTADIGEGSCNEEGNPGLTYKSGTDLLSVKGALNGTCGPAEIHGEVTLETANGTPVTIA
jgi:hypothetical protein